MNGVLAMMRNMLRVRHSLRCNDNKKRVQTGDTRDVCCNIIHNIHNRAQAPNQKKKERE